MSAIGAPVQGLRSAGVNSRQPQQLLASVGPARFTCQFAEPVCQLSLAFDAHEKAMSTTKFQQTLKAIRNSPPNQHVLRAFATGPAQTEPSSGELYLVEHVDFLPMVTPGPE